MAAYDGEKLPEFHTNYNTALENANAIKCILTLQPDCSYKSVIDLNNHKNNASGISMMNEYLQLQENALSLYNGFILQYLINRLDGKTFSHQPELRERLIETTSILEELLSLEASIFSVLENCNEKPEAQALKPRLDLMIDDEATKHVAKKFESRRPSALNIMKQYKEPEDVRGAISDKKKTFSPKTNYDQLTPDSDHELESSRQMDIPHHRCRKSEMLQQLDKFETDNFTRVRIKKKAEKKMRRLAQQNSRGISSLGTNINQLSSFSDSILMNAKK